jgi:hypothetical protein
MTTEVEPAQQARTLRELSQDVSERHLANFALLLGKPVEEARPIFLQVQQKNSQNPAVLEESLKDEIKVISLVKGLASRTAAGQPIKVVPGYLRVYARSNGIRLTTDRMILAMDRVSQKLGLQA